MTTSQKSSSLFPSARLSTIVLATTLVMAATPAHADWITSWSAAPVRPMTNLGPSMAAPSFKNQTLAKSLRISAGGKAQRVRLTNLYGEKPLDIGVARVALLDKDG